MIPKPPEEARSAAESANGASETGAQTPDAARLEYLDQLGQQAMRAFWRDLPQLIKERYRQWVAYHGDQQIGFARSSYELYQECDRRGFDLDEVLIRSIEEEMPGLVIGRPPPEEWPDECMEW
jgi:hypothetical protein